MQIQNRIKSYWEGEASRNSEGTGKEMNSVKKQAWLNLIDESRTVTINGYKNYYRKNIY